MVVRIPYFGRDIGAAGTGAAALGAMVGVGILAGFRWDGINRCLDGLILRNPVCNDVFLYTLRFEI